MQNRTKSFRIMLNGAQTGTELGSAERRGVGGSRGALPLVVQVSISDNTNTGYPTDFMVHGQLARSSPVH
eukprot:1368888-Prymnesium_polylepis.1